jgi:hypothetical protein
MIIVTYFVPFNQASAANILTNIRSFRSISGIKNYIVTSAGNANGSRWQIAGGTIRPGNGYDSNDMNKESWTVVDYPGIAGTAIDYGFESRPEGANTTYWGYSGSDNNSWGWDADIVIVAQEIAQ